jgi:hypothetical protein
MGKKARLKATAGASGSGSGSAGTAVATVDAASLPVVGLREACPCGSGKRYKACHGRVARVAEAQLVTRPFEGLAGECDLVALREIVPSATAQVRTTAEFGAAAVSIVTVLPMAWPALHRTDGTVLVALQTMGDGGDASRDAAAALLAALDAAPGTPVESVGRVGAGPRLQDVLDGAPLEVVVHEGFDFWPEVEALVDDEITPEVKASMDQAGAAAVPTARLTSVDAAYWCAIGERRHLRWVMPHPEEQLLDGLARLHAAGESALVEGARYVGAFRADGLMVPVWDLAPDTTADDVEKPAAAFGERLVAAMAVTEPLSVLERRARAGVVSRQLTLR